MPPDVFWNGDPSWFYSYVEATARKWKREEEYRAHNIDYQSWLTGLYCYEGFSVVVSNSFKKGAKAKYPKEPISVKQYKKDRVSDEEAKVKQLESQFLGFKALAEAMNRRV